MVVAILKAQFFIEGFRFHVLPGNFKVERFDSETARRLFHELQRPAAPTSPAIVFAQVELIHEGVAAQEIEAVTKTEHNIADRRLAVENEPDSTQRWVPQQLEHSGWSVFRIESM